MLYRESRGGEDVHVCVRPDGSGVVIPSWMFDSARCASMLLVERGHPSLAALCEARAILDEVRSDRLAIVPNNRSQEQVHSHTSNVALSTLRIVALATKNAFLQKRGLLPDLWMPPGA